MMPFSTMEPPPEEARASFAACTMTANDVIGERDVERRFSIADRGYVLENGYVMERAGATFSPIQRSTWPISGVAMTLRTFRIGQIVPSSNTTMETEIPAMLRARELGRPSEKFTFHSSRMRMKRVSPEELAAMNQEGLRCAAELADARVDVMSTACLVAIMAQGPGYHRQVENDLRQAIRNAGAASKVMTSAGALIYGLKTIGAKKVALLAPYTKSLTDKVVEYIEHEGIEVLDRICFEIQDNLEVGSRDPMQLLQDVKRLNVANADAVVLSACVQMQSLAAIAPAERMLALPVTSTAICTVRNMLDLLGLEPTVPMAGTLLATPLREFT